MKTFRERVYDVVRAIPKGSTLTYRQVAERAGSSRAYRVVGSFMKANLDPEIPCHRVIRSDGTVGEYNNGGPERKRLLLVQEGALKST